MSTIATTTFFIASTTFHLVFSTYVFGVGLIFRPNDLMINKTLPLPTIVDVLDTPPASQWKPYFDTI